MHEIENIGISYQGDFARATIEAKENTHFFPVFSFLRPFTMKYHQKSWIKVKSIKRNSNKILKTLWFRQFSKKFLYKHEIEFNRNYTVIATYSDIVLKTLHRIKILRNSKKCAFQFSWIKMFSSKIITFFQLFTSEARAYLIHGSNANWGTYTQYGTVFVMLCEHIQLASIKQKRWMRNGAYIKWARSTTKTHSLRLCLRRKRNKR